MFKSRDWITGLLAVCTFAGCSSDGVPADVRTTTQPLCTLQPTQMTPSAPGPIAPGGSVSIEASALCGTSETPQFRVRYRLNGTKSWANVRQWGGPSFTWDTTGLVTGLYELRIETRSIGFGPGVQTWDKIDYAVGDVCTDATLLALDPTPQAAGDAADFHATAVCPIGKVPEFQYLVRREGQTALTVERDWAPSGDFAWYTSGEPAGVHRVQVRVRAAGNASEYEVKRAKEHELVDCAQTPAHSVCASASVKINEIRQAEPGGVDNNEYVELAGTPGTSLQGLQLLVLGDALNGSSGVIEEVVNLDGQQIPADGFFLIAENTFTMGTPNLVTTLTFEDPDNVTHLLVQGFSGADGMDLDTNDDCVLDVAPWEAIVDRVALILEEGNPPSTTECHYAVGISETVGPDGLLAPSQVYRCPDFSGAWSIGLTDPLDVNANDTPGIANECN